MENISVTNNKINWISILQGYSIMLVVIGHIALSDLLIDPQYPISGYINRVIYEFHMPLFMFLAGFLLYLTKVSRKSSYKELIRDKFYRLLIPYICFTIFTFFIKLATNPFMKRKIEISFSYVIKVFFWDGYNPLLLLWFIPTLFLLFLLYPLYLESLKSVFKVILFLIASYVIYELGSTISCDMLYFTRFSKYLIFFYLGILFSKYKTYNYLGNTFVLSILFLLFAFFVVYQPILHSILLSLIGILFSISLCMNLSKIKPSLFHYFRDYTFQIYLLSFFVQMPIRYIYMFNDNRNLYIPLYLLSFSLAMYLPVMISKIVVSLKNNYLKILLGLK